MLVNLVVVGTAIAFSLVAAVLCGLALSTVLFVIAMSSNVVRRRYRNPGSLSRVSRSEDETAALLTNGSDVAMSK